MFLCVFVVLCVCGFCCLCCFVLIFFLCCAVLFCVVVFCVWLVLYSFNMLSFYITLDTMNRYIHTPSLEIDIGDLIETNI